MRKAKPAPRPFEVFRTAEQFRDVCKTCRQDNLEAIIAINTFCIELYLKCICYDDGCRENIETHHLDTLYGRLSLEDQTNIRNEFEAKRFKPSQADARVTDLQFDDALKSASNSFVEFRYFAEGKPQSYQVFELRDILRGVVLKRHNECRGARVNKNHKILATIQVR
jgi:hypothetical protein